MNKLEQEVAKRLLLLVGEEIAKIGVTMYAHNGWAKREDICYEEFNENFFSSVVAFIEESGRIRCGARFQLDKREHEKWYFGKYLIDLIASNGEDLEHSFGIAFEPNGSIESQCQTCCSLGCSLLQS